MSRSISQADGISVKITASNELNQLFSVEIRKSSILFLLTRNPTTPINWYISVHM